MKSPTSVAAVLSSIMLVAGLAGCADGSGVSTEATPEAATATSSASGATREPASNNSAAAPASEHNDADVAFSQMMIVHHEGALEMAELAVKEADSGDVEALAGAIEAAQMPEITLMESWLKSWGEPRDPVGHAGMDHGGMDMNGMSQQEVMDELQKTSGPDFDKLFLTAMIAHHEGAVLMSEDQLDAGENPDALALAQQIIDAQKTEIALMQQLLQNP